jgi:supervillin
MTNSATHTPLSRGSSIEKDETVTAFDAISSMAQKNLLSTASDHKRAVRPKLRQKPSATHMQILNDRKDISNDLEKAAGNTSKVDPNSYSTYMSKKVLDPTALAGLAAKLDFTTVKLKKTGIVEQMIADTQISKRGATDSHTQYGVEFTSHPVMLLHIKGRKLIQTRLAQPVASSVNSGDVFILLTKKDLFIFQGKTSNVIEKARGTDIVNRIQQRSELGCCAKSVVHIEENDNFSEKSKSFWNILQGKQPMKEDTSPSDDVYEKKINLTTRIYVFVQEGDNVGKYTQINEESPAMPKIAILDSKKIFVFDFFTEVYVWIGKRSPVAQRKSAVIKARKIFESNGSPPSFKNTNATPASPSRKISIAGGTRASGRFSTKQRYGTLNSSARRKSSRTLERKSSKSDLVARPDWSLFTSLGEGSETILFREKFADWPEPGRIIKMKGHESSGEVHKPPPMPELQPVDTKTMLKPRAKFEGLRLDGENIHRGLGNFKVTRSTFACNRVRSQNISVYQVKEYESVLMDEKRNGLLYSGEGYVIRWSYIITVVKELEGLTSVNRSSDRKSRGAESFNEGTDELEFDDEGTNDKTRQMLESGGRNCCAYFFWQGQNASINEKGATAVLTILMDTEKGAQIRVLQGKEHPAFLQLFKGGLIVLLGKSPNNELVKCSQGYRLYYCGGSRKREAYLLEINSNQKSLSYFLRSRGCYVVQHEPSSSVYLWMGGQATDVCCNVAKFAAKNLIQRLDSYKLINVTEGKEPPDLKSLLGSESIYQMPSSSLSYSPRLFMLSSSSGWFVADEVVHSACPDTDDLVDTFPFLQQDLYEAIQPTTFLLDCYFVIYLWIGWWPEQKNVLFKEKNAFAGTALSRWARDKKLSIQTAINYANDCKRDPLPKVYVVNAGHEHHEFVSMFPIWNEDLEVKSLVAKVILYRIGHQTLHVYSKFHLLVFTCIFKNLFVYLLVSTFQLSCIYHLQKLFKIVYSIVYLPYDKFSISS